MSKKKTHHKGLDLPNLSLQEALHHHRLAGHMGVDMGMDKVVGRGMDIHRQWADIRRGWEVDMHLDIPHLGNPLLGIQLPDNRKGEVRLIDTGYSLSCVEPNPDVLLRVLQCNGSDCD